MQSVPTLTVRCQSGNTTFLQVIAYQILTKNSHPYSDALMSEWAQFGKRRSSCSRENPFDMAD